MSQSDTEALSPASTLSPVSEIEPVMLNRYDRRVETGLYSNLRDKILETGELTLEGANLNEHFHRANANQHFKFVANSDNIGEDCHFLAFGETCSSMFGTQMTSRGNKVNFNVQYSFSTSVKHY
jgi:hypothetical protein